MKILHIITSLRTGGAEKLMVDLLPRLKEMGVGVELCLHDGINTPFKRQLEEKGIKIFDLGKGGSVYSPIKFLKLLPKLKGYDIIHTHNTAPQIFIALYSIFSNKKFVTTEHGGSNRRRNIKFFRLLDKWLYKKYHKIICIADKTEENLKKYLGSGPFNILTINNGIDVNGFLNANPSTELENIAPDSKKIIMVAGFRWEKDQPSLIRALSHLPDKFHIFLVGDGTRKEEYLNLSQSLIIDNRVHFLGIRTDVPSLLKASDYVVMSSHFEGLSLSSVEGMAAGSPMIASDVDGLREVVGGAGLLFEHENAEDLATKILELENNPSRYSMVAKDCAKKALEYDISKMVEGYLGVYSSIV